MNNYIVLLFHSIDDRELSSLKNLGNIRPEIFERLLLTLRDEFDIVSLKEIVDCISGKTEKQGQMLAITFDDGPRSYAVNAVPIMESLGIPSTCFLITDCIGDNAIYWRYLYNFCINRGYGRELEEMINAEYKTSIRQEDIISFTRSNYNKEKNRHIVNNILKHIVPEEEYMRTEQDLFLSYGDIEILKESPMVSFGIHTRTHPVMMRLSDEEIFGEISGSLNFYRTKIKESIPMFSIPFGRLYEDYDERVIIAALNLSIEVIFSAYGGSNKKGQPACNIRRISLHEGLLENGINSFKDRLKEMNIEDEYIRREKRLLDALSGLNSNSG